MAEYAQVAHDFKARLKAKVQRKINLDAFFEGIRSNIAAEVEKANSALSYESAPIIGIKRESPDEPTIDLACASATCHITQDRSEPSISAQISGEAGDKTLTFLIQTEEAPYKARRVSLAPQSEEKVAPSQIAATIIEELIMGAP